MASLDPLKIQLLRLRRALRRETAAASAPAAQSGDAPDAAASAQDVAQRRWMLRLAMVRARQGAVPRAPLDELIARGLAQAERSGELRSAPSHGQPLAEDPGWAQTPAEVRMPFKALKNAGVLPAEVELMKDRAALRAQLAAATDAAEQRRLQQALALLEQNLALRLESLRR